MARKQQGLVKRSSRVRRAFRDFLLTHFDGQAPVLLREVANLHEDGVVRFERRYAPHFDRYTKSELFHLRDELRTLWTRGKHMPDVVATVWDEKQAAATGTSLEQFICNAWLSRVRRGFQMNLWGEIEPDPSELSAWLAYAFVLCGDRMRMCRNRDCPAPYFVAGRRDQRYCSAECAAPAKLAAKRRCWHLHKREWTSRSKRRKPAGRARR